MSEPPVCDQCDQCDDDQHGDDEAAAFGARGQARRADSIEGICLPGLLPAHGFGYDDRQRDHGPRH